MIFSILLAFFSVFSWANDPCGDFYQFACSDEARQRYTDGTGIVNSDAAIRTIIGNTLQSGLERYQSEFPGALAQDPELAQRVETEVGCGNKHFRRCGEFREAMADLSGIAYNYRVAVILGQNQDMDFDLPISLVSDVVASASIQRLSAETRQRLEVETLAATRHRNLDQGLFRDVKATMVNIVNQLPESPSRAAMVNRINEVQYSDDLCLGDDFDPFDFSASYFGPTIDNPTPNVRVCLNALLRSDSLFSLIHVVTHEVAHSIDPCEWDVSMVDGPNAWTGLVQCFSNPASGGVEVRCEKGSAPLREAFCDWMASEVMAQLVGRVGNLASLSSQEVVQGLVNAHPMCGPNRSSMSGGGTHIPTPMRMNMIASQPDLRRRMGCSQESAPLRYCPLGGIAAGPEPEGDLTEVEE